MTEAEKWRTLAQVLAVTVPVGTLIGFGLGRARLESLGRIELRGVQDSVELFATTRHPSTNRA